MWQMVHQWLWRHACAFRCPCCFRSNGKLGLMIGLSPKICTNPESPLAIQHRLKRSRRKRSKNLLLLCKKPNSKLTTSRAREVPTLDVLYVPVCVSLAFSNKRKCLFLVTRHAHMLVHMASSLWMPMQSCKIIATASVKSKEESCESESWLGGLILQIK